MIKKTISWGLVGVFTFLWWWLGHGWDYLAADESGWSRVFWIITLISLVVLLRGARPTDSGMFGRLIGTLRGFVPNLAWLVLVVIVMQIGMMVRGVIVDPVDHLVHAVATALAAGIATALWFGAIANADDA